MPTPIRTVREALMADVLAHPAEDWPRLVLADWLEEHGGEPERAEFIRVQVEFNRHPWSGPIREANYDARDGVDAEWAEGFALFDRIMKLFWASGRLGNWSDWCWCESRDGDGRPQCASERGGMVVTPHGSPGLGGHPDSCTVPTDAGQVEQRFRRGFVEEVRLPLQAWLTHGPAIVAAHPVTKVVLTDRMANSVGNDRCWWSRANYDTSIELDWWLPQAMFDLLEYDPAHFDNAFPGINRCYPTKPDAVAALSAAALAWAKQ